MKFVISYLRKYKGYLVLAFVVFYLIAAFYLALTLPYIHDYGVYLSLWKDFLATGHPYLLATKYVNAYGILESGFAFLARLNSSAPRIFFVFLWFTVSFSLLHLAEKQKDIKKFIVVLLFTLLNPAFFIFFVVLGNNEIVVASLILSSIYYLDRKRNEVASGVCLSLGFLFKISPVFLIPFFLIGKDRVRTKLLLSTGGVILLGLILGYIKWGKEIFAPFGFVFGRSATFMSILYPIKHFTGSDLSFISFPVLVVALSVTFLLHLKYRYDLVKISIIVMLEVLLISKVNLPQYYIDLFLLLVYYVITRLNFKTRQVKVIFIYLIGYSIIPVSYYFLGGFAGSWGMIRNLIAIPIFIADILLLYSFFRPLSLKQ